MANTVNCDRCKRHVDPFVARYPKGKDGKHACLCPQCHAREGGPYRFERKYSFLINMPMHPNQF